MDDYFLSLPNDVLLEKIFSLLSLTEITRLCSVHPRLATVCAGDDFWRNRALDEFPSEVHVNPEQLSWRNYYRFLAEKRIPLYYHGDRISRIPFNFQLLDLTLSMITPYIKLEGTVNIVFIGSRRIPILIVKYPEMKIIAKSGNYDNITKVLFFVNDEFEKEVPQKETRGRRPIKGKEGTKHDPNISIIYNELTSNLGHPPLYGLSYQLSDRGYGFNLTIPNDKLGEFHIIMPSRDRRMSSNPRRCKTFTPPQLIQMALNLDFLPEQLRQTFEHTGTTGICLLIKKRLEEIGHIL